MGLTFEDSLIIASKYCVSRERCEQDVIQYLNKKGLYDSDTIEKVVNNLREEGFLDDFRYAKAFVHDKFLLNKWGRIKIKYALKQKGIDETITEKALLEEINDAEYEQCLETLIMKKKKNLKKGNPAVLKQKIVNFAISKGYEFELVQKIVESIVK